MLYMRYLYDGGLFKREYSWDDNVELFKHIFRLELRVNSEEHPILVTEPSTNRSEDREKMTKQLFEKHKVPAVYMAPSALVALYASGRITGLSFGCGHSLTESVPIYETQLITHAITRTNFGGKDIDEQLLNLIKQGKKFEGDNIDVHSHTFKERLIDYKEKLSYVALSYKDEYEKSQFGGSGDQFFDLPDGKQINSTLITHERFSAPEILFNPSRIIKTSPDKEDFSFEKKYPKMPIHKLIHESIKKCPIELRKEMYTNIILFGGSTMFDGIVERLSDEIQKFAPSGQRIKISAPAERKYSVWIGGSIITSLSTFSREWITLEEYNEVGPSIVQRKCYCYAPLIERPEPHKDVHGDEVNRIRFVLDEYIEDDYNMVASFCIKMVHKNLTITLPRILL